jgi:hypothetical protein
MPNRIADSPMCVYQLGEPTPHGPIEQIAVTMPSRVLSSPPKTMSASVIHGLQNLLGSKLIKMLLSYLGRTQNELAIARHSPTL